MLNQITPTRAPHQPPEDALDLLMGCHQRIRHFTSTAAKLAHAHGATNDEIRMAAAGVYRYFAVSLPLHEADEEDTLRPRLDALGDQRVQLALAAMHDQHQAIDELVERLLPLLLLVERNPASIEQAGGEMCAITKALEEIFAAHLQLEEEAIFPAIRQNLPEGTRAEMLAEMQARRQQGS
jgi:iron-sulfur cluster repair protein YtfE (RIC family)